MKLAIIKPDHLGDLILSAPAIRAVRRRYSDATLFVSSRNLSLARLLFGDIELRALDLPHLSKGGYGQQGNMDLTDFDLALFLRHDHVLNPQRAQMLCPDFIFFPPSNDYHQSVLDYTVASRVVGGYDIDDAFYAGDDCSIRDKAMRPPTAIGLCIGAGFFANAWPAVHWVALGRALQASGHRVALICGPSETTVASCIAGAIGLAEEAITAVTPITHGFSTGSPNSTGLSRPTAVPPTCARSSPRSCRSSAAARSSAMRRLAGGTGC